MFHFDKLSAALERTPHSSTMRARTYIAFISEKWMKPKAGGRVTTSGNILITSVIAAAGLMTSVVSTIIVEALFEEAT
ncbi:hypothetical protein [Nitrobacter sp.]|uniref:hypothetical protein n=1 Tax=Nitrobacter sp. TaxID=29420 RepID=UPI003F654296